ncbi:MAG: DUF5050 domain-containing protein [Tissierellia bacterium]|nr:DUF5050 domain-containing protein [Tissierellia bacterium]
MLKKRIIVLSIVSMMLIFTGCNTKGKIQVVEPKNQTTSQEKVEFQDESIGNLINEGIAVKRDGLIYFSDACWGGICSIKPDGTDFNRISDDSGGYLNVIDAWIFYYSENSVKKVKTNGKDMQTIFKVQENDYIRWLKVTNDFIYYYNGDKFIQTDHTGKNQTILLKNEAMWSINMIGDNVYYPQVNSKSKLEDIIVFNLKSKTKRTIKAGITGIGDDLYSFIIKGDNIFYLIRSNDSEGFNTINKVKLSGDDREEIYKTRYNVHSINMKGDWIYFVRSDEKRYELICRVNINSGNEEILPFHPTYRLYESKWLKLQDDENPFDSPGDLNIVDGWIFYENVYGHNSYLQAINIGEDKEDNTRNNLEAISSVDFNAEPLTANNSDNESLSEKETQNNSLGRQAFVPDYESINKLLKMSKQDIIQMLGNEYEIVGAGAEHIEKGYKSVVLHKSLTKN